MIICSCNALSDHDVRAALGCDAQPRRVSDVYGCLGCRPNCGTCARTIREIMREAGVEPCASSTVCHAGGANGPCERISNVRKALAEFA